MKIQQIRNATIKLSYAGKIFLIDPWLTGRHKFGCFADLPGKPFSTPDPVREQIPMPICELPMDNVAHATITRHEMRALLAKRKINCLMPEDGETLKLN